MSRTPDYLKYSGKCNSRRRKEEGYACKKINLCCAESASGVARAGAGAEAEAIR